MKYTTVITSYNRRHCIERAIDSALTELPGQEITVVDDASTDGTVSFLQTRYADEIAAGIVSLHCLQENVGVTGAKNRGYERARGDWVMFLDSDDHYESGAGEAIRKEIAAATGHPVVFFRCRTHTGEFVGQNQGKRMPLDLATYLHFTSFGEALTAVNKAMAGASPPYLQELRGYEGIGCARLIHRLGPAILSSVVARVYVTQGDDRLSASRGLLRRMPLLAAGHFQMIREFGRHMKMKRMLALTGKALVYIALSKGYRLLGKD